MHAWQAAGDPYQEAGARWRLAWALVADRSGRAEAATHLAWAAETAARLGARPLGTAVARVAARWRLPAAPARWATSSLAAALTARELEVLPLLAAGRSNAEIAEILVISPRTVGTHVSRILHKLGADRRAQVADLAAVPAADDDRRARELHRRDVMRLRRGDTSSDGCLLGTGLLASRYRRPKENRCLVRSS